MFCKRQDGLGSGTTPKPYACPCSRSAICNHNCNFRPKLHGMKLRFYSAVSNIAGDDFVFVVVVVVVVNVVVIDVVYVVS